MLHGKVEVQGLPMYGARARTDEMLAQTRCSHRRDAHTDEMLTQRDAHTDEMLAQTRCSHRRDARTDEMLTCLHGVAREGACIAAWADAEGRGTGGRQRCIG
eukprot:363504-Chlamydomonas_euryale.AAC.7